MENDGWKLWDTYNWGIPPDGVLIEIYRPEWNHPRVCYRHELHPQMNAVGLYWRLTGIGKEQLDRTPSQQRECYGGFANMLNSLLGSSGQLGVSQSMKAWQEWEETLSPLVETLWEASS